MSRGNPCGSKNRGENKNGAESFDRQVSTELAAIIDIHLNDSVTKMAQPPPADSPQILLHMLCNKITGLKDGKSVC